MRIGYFMETMTRPSETFVYDLFMGLQAKDDQTTLYLGSQTRQAGKNIRHLIYTGHADLNKKKLKYIRDFSQLIRRGDQNVNDYKKKFTNRKLNRLATTDLPSVAFTDFLTTGTLLMKFFEDHKIPFVVHVHGFDITFKLADYAYRADLPLLFEKAAFFIVASHHIKRLMILNGCPEEKIRLVRLGIDVASIQALPLQERTPHPSIIFLGRLTLKKHPVALLHAFQMVQQQIPEARLTLIGDGPVRKDCERVIRQFGLQDKVKMTGAISREEAFPILARHWIYAQHSVTSLFGDQEGFAISPAEAAAHELPVVATLHNGIPEHVIDGETGFLVREYDYESMAERIIQLIGDPALRHRLGQSGRQRISALCVPEKRTEEIYTILKQAYQEKKS